MSWRQLCVGLLFQGVTSVAVAQSNEDAGCDAQFSAAVAELAQEHYGQMLKFAKERMRTCPGPRSALLIGLAEANLVDAQGIADPAQRELTRKSALRHLRIAATQGAGLPAEWLMTVGEWIVNLQARGPSAPAELAGAEPRPWVEDLELRSPSAVLPFEIPMAPPPKPRPQFPWGPLLLGTGGVGATATGFAFLAAANARYHEASSAVDELTERRDEFAPDVLRQHVREVANLQQEADGYARWSQVMLMGGGAALAGALVWYFLLPPAGQWRWAVAPAAVQASWRF